MDDDTLKNGWVMVVLLGLMFAAFFLPAQINCVSKPDVTLPVLVKQADRVTMHKISHFCAH